VLFLNLQLLRSFLFNFQIFAKGYTKNKDHFAFRFSSFKFVCFPLYYGPVAICSDNITFNFEDVSDFSFVQDLWWIPNVYVRLSDVNQSNFTHFASIKNVIFRKYFNCVDVHFEIKNIIFEFACSQIHQNNFSLKCLKKLIGISFLDFHHILIVHDIVAIPFIKSWKDVSVSSTSISELCSINHFQGHGNTLAENFLFWMEVQGIDIVADSLLFDFKNLHFILIPRTQNQCQH